MRVSSSLLIVLLVLAVGTALAQSTTDPEYVMLAESEEIALARSAAPDVVSDEATIWVLRDGQYEVAVKGTNQNHCFVARSQPKSLEPVCYDDEAAATILHWEFEYLALRLAGKSQEEMELALAEAVGSGALPMPNRPAMSYMMSSAQRLYDPESGKSAGSWKPHIMLYIPYLTEQSIGLSEATGFLQVARAGTPMAYLVVVVPDFVDPKSY